MPFDNMAVAAVVFSAGGWCTATTLQLHRVLKNTTRAELKVDVLFEVLGIDVSGVKWDKDGRDRITTRIIRQSRAGVRAPRPEF